MSKYIDTHIHTNISDGTLSIPEVVEIAKRNTSIFAITDHDTLIDPEKIKPLLKGACVPFVVPGIEISAYVPHRTHGKILVHVLGYGLGKSPKLDSLLHELKENRMDANKVFLNAFLNNFLSIPMETFSRVDISRYGRFSEYMSDAILESKIDVDLKRDAIGYLRQNEPKLMNYDARANAVIDAIHSAHGYAVLAHPIKYTKKYSLSELNIKEMIKSLTNMGLDGLEAFHSDHDKEFAVSMLKLTKEFNLLFSSGSDCHGPKKGSEIIGHGKNNNLCISKTSLTNKILQERLYLNQGGIR